jgi:peroxiredoxin Q/BCP
MKKLTAGDAAPPFSLSDQDGNTVSLSDFKGRFLLVYFYPKADTPGCTIQACSVRDSMADLKKDGLAVVGISPDQPGAQKKFDNKYSLGFPLLADEGGEIAQAYGVWDKKTFMGKTRLGVVRSAFLVNGEGVLTNVWYKVSPQDTVPKAREAVKEAGG